MLPTAAFAYIDPGSGAILLQVLLAMLLTLGVLCRRILLAPFRILFRRHDAQAAAEESKAGTNSGSGDGTSDGTD